MYGPEAKHLTALSALDVVAAEEPVTRAEVVEAAASDHVRERHHRVAHPPEMVDAGCPRPTTRSGKRGPPPQRLHHRHGEVAGLNAPAVTETGRQGALSRG
jgi:hypothetical protein